MATSNDGSGCRSFAPKNMPWYPFCCSIVNDDFSGSLDTIHFEIVSGSWSVSSGSLLTSSSDAIMRINCPHTRSNQITLNGNSSWNDNPIKLLFACDENFQNGIKVTIKYRTDAVIVPGRVEVDVDDGTSTQQMDFGIPDTWYVRVGFDEDAGRVSIDLGIIDMVLTAGQTFPVALSTSAGLLLGIGVGAISGTVAFTSIDVERITPTGELPGCACSTLAQYDRCYQASPCGLSPLGNSADPSEGDWGWQYYYDDPLHWTFTDLRADWSFPGSGSCGSATTGAVMDAAYRWLRVTERGSSIPVLAAIDSCSTNGAGAIFSSLSWHCLSTPSSIGIIVWEASIDTTPSGGGCTDPCAVGDSASAGATLESLPLGHYVVFISVNPAPFCDPDNIPPMQAHLEIGDGSGALALMEAC